MIDPVKDPEGYAKYMKEREEKRKQERQKERIAAENEKRLKGVQLSDSRDFKVGSQVVVSGLQKNPEKNGALGTLRKYVADKERWTVEFIDGSNNNFKVDNLKLVREEETPKASTTETEEDIDAIPTSKVYINNMAATTSGEDLTTLFSKIGMIAKEPIKNAKGFTQGYEDEWPFAVKLYKPGIEGGDACVKFVDKLAAKAAIKAYDGYVLNGSTISVAFAGSGAIPDDVIARRRDRSRSRERLAELERLRKRIKDNEIPHDLIGIFGPQ